MEKNNVPMQKVNMQSLIFLSSSSSYRMMVINTHNPMGLIVSRDVAMATQIRRDEEH